MKIVSAISQSFEIGQIKLLSQENVRQTLRKNVVNLVRPCMCKLCLTSKNTKSDLVTIIRSKLVEKKIKNNDLMLLLQL